MLIGVHMKAGRGASPRAVRDRQAGAIAQFIAQETSGTEKDVLVVGDFNMIPGQDVSNFHEMSQGEFLDFISSWDLREGVTHVKERTPGNLLDGFAISAGRTREYLPGSLEVFPLHRAMNMSIERYRVDVSDHLPFVARFKITRDDD